MAALDERIARRAGDASFDIRPEDDFKTLGELESDRQHHRDRITQLMPLRDDEERSRVGFELERLARRASADALR